MYEVKSIKDMSHEDWLRLRKTGIGGSDDAAICGLNPYVSAIYVFQDKTSEELKVKDNEPMRQGRDLEDYVAKRFCEATGFKARRSHMLYRSTSHSFMIADVDRLLVGQDAGLECKTASAYGYDQWKDGQVPTHYLIQCLHYMAVTGKREWYLMDVIDRYLKEGKQPDIHMMVLYTADIEKSKTVFSRTACKIQVEASYMTGLPSEEWLKEARRGIADHAVTDEILMHLVLLPLTYKGEEKKQEAIRVCVDLARQLPDKEQETFALAGILTFTDKIINDETKRYIKEVLGMTQVGKMLMDDARQETKKRTAKNMLKRGDTLEDIAEVLEVSIETIKAWEKEFYAVV